MQRAGWPRAAPDCPRSAWCASSTSATSTGPRIVSRLQLEVNDPSNCRQVIPDLVGLSGFTYDSHYCSTDDPQNATALACAFFESGIRVFDIRDAAAAAGDRLLRATFRDRAELRARRTRAQHPDGRPDHCSAQMRLDAATAGLMTTCQDNGFLTLKFTHGVWPFTRPASQPD